MSGWVRLDGCFPNAFPRRSLVSGCGVEDLLKVGGLWPVDAFGVDAEENVDAVTGPGGDLGGVPGCL